MNDVYWDFHNLAKAMQLREHVHGSTGMEMLHIPTPSTKSLRQFHLYLAFTSESEGVLQCLAMRRIAFRRWICRVIGWVRVDKGKAVIAFMLTMLSQLERHKDAVNHYVRILILFSSML